MMRPRNSAASTTFSFTKTTGLRKAGSTGSANWLRLELPQLLAIAVYS
jgi:hypothetical protein